MTPLRSVLLLIVLAASSWSCSRTTGAGAADVPGENFVRLYADLLVAREEAPLRGLPDGDTRLRDSLYRAYHVTPQEFDAAIARAKADIAVWKEFHARVTRRLEEVQKDLASRPATPTLP
jgi:hypothetical protein